MPDLHNGPDSDGGERAPPQRQGDAGAAPCWLGASKLLAECGASWLRIANRPPHDPRLELPPPGLIRPRPPQCGHSLSLRP